VHSHVPAPLLVELSPALSEFNKAISPDEMNGKYSLGIEVLGLASDATVIGLVVFLQQGFTFRGTVFTIIVRCRRYIS